MEIKLAKVGLQQWPTLLRASAASLAAVAATERPMAIAAPAATAAVSRPVPAPYASQKNWSAVEREINEVCLANNWHVYHRFTFFASIEYWCALQLVHAFDTP